MSKTSKNRKTRKMANSVDNNKSLLWQDDPGQLLNAWLGELDSLQKVRIEIILILQFWNLIRLVFIIPLLKNSLTEF